MGAVVASAPMGSRAVMGALLVMAAFGGASAGCQVARTEVVVRVESELAWGEGAALQSVVLTVRRGGASGPLRSERTTALGRGAGRSALPMHVGVLEASDDRDTPLWLEARGCAGPNGCSAEEAAVVQRAVVGFVPESRVLVTLLLASACVGVRCGAEELCVPTTGQCRPAVEAATVVGTGGWPDAGRGGADGGRDDAAVPAVDGAVPSGMRLLQGGLETTASPTDTVGTLRLSETGLVSGERACVGSLCLTGGVMP